jgi:hypothetical protein
VIDHFSAQLAVSNQTDDHIRAFVTLEDSLPQNYRTTILGISGDSLCYAITGAGTFATDIPLTKFPGGIASLLLFNEQQRLCSERKIYVQKNNYSVDVKTNKKNYKARENAVLSIKVTDAEEDPLMAALNISVEDAWIAQLSDSIGQINVPPSDEFALGNWLKIHAGEYSPQDIDLVMAMTRSSLHHSTESDSTNDLDNDEKLLNLLGTITDKKDKPLQDRVVTVIAKYQNNIFSDVDTTREDGSFKIPLPQNMDSLLLSVQITDKHNVPRSDYKLIVNKFSFPDFKTPAVLEQSFFISEMSTATLVKKRQIDTIFTFEGKGWLQPVRVTAYKNEQPNYDVSKRISSISEILTSDKFRYGGYNAVGYAVLTIPGVTLTYNDISVFGPNTDVIGHITRPLLVVDGYAYPTDNIINFLNSLNPGDIDFIEVLRGGEAGIYGIRGGAGVISVNTKHGPDDMDFNSNLRLLVPLTYHVCPKFLMPDYSKTEIKNSKIADQRTTIYWNGNVITDTNGEANINFFTADNATNYIVTVTGLSSKGDIINKRIVISRN